jgi:hypothetical protein
VKRFFPLLILVFSCSPKVIPPDPDSLKPSWLKSTPYLEGYYVGIGQSIKTGDNNYIQSAKRSALDDLVGQIKVTVSGTSILSQLEVNMKLTEQYQQIIKTTTADEIEEFELVDAYEDATNYWVYYRLSVARYRQIKEEQKRSAVLLATDYLVKARQADKNNERLQAMGFYFQALRSIEKYLGEAIAATVDGKEILLGNEIYASIQTILDKIILTVKPTEITLNRRVNQSESPVTAKVTYKDTGRPASLLTLAVAFEKGSGDVFPSYKTDQNGNAKIMITRIGSRELEQSLSVKVDIDALSGSGASPVYALIAKTFNVPRAQVNMKLQRPVAYIMSDEKTFGLSKNTPQISNKLRNLLANNGFEFTEDKRIADLLFDIRCDSEKGSVSGSIFVTYLTGVIKVTAAKGGKEIYATAFDRVRGYGLDYDKSSADAYSKALETLEKERIAELLNTVLQ